MPSTGTFAYNNKVPSSLQSDQVIDHDHSTDYAPATHASQHEDGGADEMESDQAAGTACLRTLGTGSTQAAAGNHTHATVPAHASTHNDGGSDALAEDQSAGTASLRTLGTGSTQAAAGNHDHDIGSGWTTISLQSGWTSYGTPYYTPAYGLDACGFVHLRGMVKGASTSTNTLFTLPSGYRPSSDLWVHARAFMDSGTTPHRLDTISIIIGSDGVVSLNDNDEYAVSSAYTYFNGGSAWVSLDSLPTFQAM